MGMTLTVSMVTVWREEPCPQGKALGQVFCYLRHQSLVSMATTVGVQGAWGYGLAGAQGAGIHLGREGQPVSMVRAGKPMMGQLAGRMVSVAVDQGGDGLKSSCRSLRWGLVR